MINFAEKSAVRCIYYMPLIDSSYKSQSFFRSWYASFCYEIFNDFI